MTQQSTPDNERFSTRKQALDWLKSSGYRVSQGKFYQDCAAGFPSINQDGSVSKYQVMQYGNNLDRASRPSAGEDIRQQHEDRKAKAEADLAEMKAERMRRDEDKLWLHADDAWAQVAALVGALRDGIRHRIYSGQREIVMVAGGDQDRSQEVFEQIEQLINGAFNDVAAGGLTVVFEREIEQ